MNDKTTTSRGRPAGSGRAKPAGRRGIAARREAIIGPKATKVRRARKTAVAETPNVAEAAERGLNRGVEADVAGATDANAGAAAAAEPVAAPVIGPVPVEAPASAKGAASVEDRPASEVASPVSGAVEAVVTTADVAMEAVPASTEAASENFGRASRARPVRKPRKAKTLTEDPETRVETPAAKPRRTRTAKIAAASTAADGAKPARKPRAAKTPKPLRKPKAAAIVAAESPVATPQPAVAAPPRQMSTVAPSQQPDFQIAAGASSETAIRLSNEIGAEMARFAEDAIAAGSDGLLNVATARTLPELIERQTRSAKLATELWMRHSGRIGEICMAAFGDIRGTG
jgi:hypothetical protein